MPSDQGLSEKNRRCLRVLRMVHELHKRGYQRIRICAGLSPSGFWWRCAVTHAGNILKSHGGMTLDCLNDVIYYGDGQEAAYFGWEDARGDTVVELADRFLKRCPEIAKAGLGRDWPYVGWYVEMLGLAERGALPMAYYDSYGPDDPNWFLTTVSADWARLPMPPGGEADDPAPDPDDEEEDEPGRDEADDLRSAVSQCMLCRNRPRDVLTACAAFPGLIPEEILENRFDHRRPWIDPDSGEPGDQGIALAGSILFEPEADADPETLARTLRALDRLHEEIPPGGEADDPDRR